MNLHRIAAEMYLWADDCRTPGPIRLREWADAINACAAPQISTGASDIIQAINGAATPEEALAAYRSARAAVLGLSLADRILVLENLMVRQAAAIGDYR